MWSQADSTPSVDPLRRQRKSGCPQDLVWARELVLEFLEETPDVKAIHQPVMNGDGDGHMDLSRVLAVLAQDDLGDGVEWERTARV